VLERETGSSSPGGHDESAFAAHIPHRQRGFEHVRVCPGFWLQGWAEDGSGECLPSLVRPQIKEPAFGLALFLVDIFTILASD